MPTDIWKSFRRLPLWVQIWMAAILVPLNLCSLAYTAEPYGLWLAALAIGGMLPNVLIMAIERGLSSAMAIPHLIFWTPLCGLAAWLLYGHFSGMQPLSDAYAGFLIALLVTNTVSLCFDYPDTLSWLRGNRSIA